VRRLPGVIDHDQAVLALNETQLPRRVLDIDETGPFSRSAA
jgi:hypothetical protein